MTALTEMQHFADSWVSPTNAESAGVESDALVAPVGTLVVDDSTLPLTGPKAEGKRSNAGPSITPADKARVMMQVVNAIEEASGRAVREANGYSYACCPAHDDRTESLTIAEGDAGVLLTCHAGCTFEEIAGALDKPLSAFFWRQKAAPSQKSTPTVVSKREHIYRNLNGTITAINTRYDYDDGSKTFAWSKKRDEAVYLYGAERLRDAVKDDRLIWVVEGEQCVDALADIGEVALSLHGGARAALNLQRTSQLAELLHGARVCLAPDGDTNGEVWREALDAALTPQARVVITIQTKAMKWVKGYDIADWLRDNTGLDPRLELKADAALTRSAAEAKPFKRVAWLWDRRIPLDALTLMGGDPGQGKSTTAAWLAALASRGQLDGEYSGQPQHCVILAREETEGMLRAKLFAHGADMRFVHIHAEDQPIEQFTNTAYWARMMRQWNYPVLVIIDPLTPMLNGRDQKDDTAMRAVFDTFKAALFHQDNPYGRALVGIRHFFKADFTSKAGYDPLDLFTGSKAGIVGVARSVLAVWQMDCEGDEDATGAKVVVSLEKSNLTRKEDVPPIVGRLEGRTVHPDGPTGDKASTVVFEPLPDTSAPSFAEHLQRRAAQAREAARPDRLKDVAEAVRERLGDQGWVTYASIQTLLSENGLDSKEGGRRVRERMKLQSVRLLGQNTGWAWFDPAVIEPEAVKKAEETLRMTAIAEAQGLD